MSDGADDEVGDIKDYKGAPWDWKQERNRISLCNFFRSLRSLTVMWLALDKCVCVVFETNVRVSRRMRPVSLVRPPSVAVGFRSRLRRCKLQLTCGCAEWSW
jgi:hypothetical protein